MDFATARNYSDPPTSLPLHDGNNRASSLDCCLSSCAPSFGFCLYLFASAVTSSSKPAIRRRYQSIMATATAMPDLEAGETTPLVGSSDEPPPLQDMKAESLKERTIMAVGGVSCKFQTTITRQRQYLAVHDAEVLSWHLDDSLDSHHLVLLYLSSRFISLNACFSFRLESPRVGFGIIGRHYCTHGCLSTTQTHASGSLGTNQ